MKNITNRDNVIDSRDVISRIEDLESTLEAEFDEHQESLSTEQERLQKLIDEDFEVAREAHAKNTSEGDEDLDKDQWLADLRNDPFSEACGTLNDLLRVERQLEVDFEDWLKAIADDDQHTYQDEARELAALRGLAEEAEGYGDWAHGETLINRSYWLQYVEEFANDIGAVNREAKWPLSHIDWEAAASELETDYTSVDFDGTEYLMRS